MPGGRSASRRIRWTGSTGRRGAGRRPARSTPSSSPAARTSSRAPVLPEVVLGAVHGGDDPVAVVVGAVVSVSVGPELVLDPVAVVLQLMPVGAVQDQLRGPAAQVQRDDVACPAAVVLPGDRALRVIGAVGVAALHVVVGEGNALADHAELVVGLRGPPVHRRRVVVQGHLRGRPGCRRRHRDRVAPGEVTRRPARRPAPRRRQRRRGEVTVRARRGSHPGQHDLRRGQQGLDQGRGHSDGHRRPGGRREVGYRRYRGLDCVVR